MAPKRRVSSVSRGTSERFGHDPRVDDEAVVQQADFEAASHQRGRRAACWRSVRAFSRATSRFFRNFFASFAGEDVASASAARTASRKRFNELYLSVKTHIARYCEKFTDAPYDYFPNSTG